MARGSKGSGRWAGYGGGYTLPVVGGGGAPDWVPDGAKIHIDLVGGDPQGRAWVEGTGEVAVDTLLGADPNTENAQSPSDYQPSALSADGYRQLDDMVGGGYGPAYIGALRSALFAGATVVTRWKGQDAVTTRPMVLCSEPAATTSIGIQTDTLDGEGGANDVKVFDFASSPINDIGILNVINLGAATFNAVAVTVTATRFEIAANGSTAVAEEMTASSWPPSGDDQLVACMWDGSHSYLQSITLYDPLPSTAGLSELSEVV